MAKEAPDLMKSYLETLRTWDHKKGLKMKGTSSPCLPDPSLLFDPHLTSGFKWGSCVHTALNVYFNKRVSSELTEDFTAEVSSFKSLTISGRSFKLINIMKMHYKNRLCNAIKIPLEKIKKKMASLKKAEQT